MSIDCITYVGAFFRCIPSNGPTVEKVRGCANPTCTQYRHNVWDEQKRFCDQCGAEITNYTYAVEAVRQHKEQIAYDELNGTLNTTDFSDGDAEKYHLFMPNEDRTGIPADRRIDNRCDTAYIDLTDPETIASEKKCLQASFFKEYEHLKLKYGEDNVSICWGVMCWMH